MNSFFLLKGKPPRETFDKDMSGLERAAMEMHIKYWQQLSKDRVNIIFSTVMDYSGIWGLAIIEVENEHQAIDIKLNDPIIRADIGFEIEIHPLQNVIMR